MGESLGKQGYGFVWRKDNYVEEGQPNALSQKSRESSKNQEIVAKGNLQDGGRLRHGDDLPPHKYIRNTSTCGTSPTEHLLNAGRRPQTSQKARNSPHTWPCGWQGLGALARCQAWASEVGEPSSGHWSIRDLPTPHNIKWQKSPRDLHLNAKTQLHSMTSKLQCWTS